MVNLRLDERVKPAGLVFPPDPPANAPPRWRQCGREFWRSTLLLNMRDHKLCHGPEVVLLMDNWCEVGVALWTIPSMISAG